MTSALSITQSANPARAVFLDYPLGNTAGPPNDPAAQLTTMRAALGAFHGLTQAGDVLVLPNVWPEPDWKMEARTLADHRSERHDTPQYQEPADKTAAEG